MKIGIDIRNLTRPLNGINRYISELIKGLLEFKDINLYLYAPSPLIKECSFILENQATLRIGNAKTLLSRQIWAETTLPRQVKEDKVDLFWGPAHRLPYFLDKKIPTVLTIHDLVYKYHPETMQTRTRVLEVLQVPYSIQRADHILADSNATKKSVIDFFNVPNDKISIVYNGIHNNNGFIPAKIQSTPDNYILFVGTLEPRKNLERLLQAYARLNDDLKNKYPLLIAGGKGWGDIALTDLIQHINIKKHVQLLGYVNDNTLDSLYAHCSFLAFPSIYEGFGIPIIEAARYGKMVLTSNTSSMPEVAGEYGFFVDPLSVDSIFNGLHYLIHNRIQMPPQTKFTWDKSVKDLISVFEKVLNTQK